MKKCEYFLVEFVRFTTDTAHSEAVFKRNLASRVNLHESKLFTKKPLSELKIVKFEKEVEKILLTKFLYCASCSAALVDI